jgi:hypothetical protein
MANQSQHDPRWHLGQCIVWIATRDLNAVVRVTNGDLFEFRNIAAAVHRQAVIVNESAIGPRQEDGAPPKLVNAVDHKSIWPQLVGELYSNRIGATGIPPGDTVPRKIDPSEFHGLNIGYSFPGSAVPHLFRKGGRTAFTDVRVLRDDVMAAFPGEPAQAIMPAEQCAVSAPNAGLSGEVKRRGRKPTKIEKVKDAMRAEIREGRRTRDGLRDMLEKNFEPTYNASRTTVRAARNAVLSENVENSIPDK